MKLVTHQGEVGPAGDVGTPCGCGGASEADSTDGVPARRDRARRRPGGRQPRKRLALLPSLRTLRSARGRRANPHARPLSSQSPS